MHTEDDRSDPCDKRNRRGSCAARAQSTNGIVPRDRLQVLSHHEIDGLQPPCNFLSPDDTWSCWDTRDLAPAPSRVPIASSYVASPSSTTLITRRRETERARARRSASDRSSYDDVRKRPIILQKGGERERERDGD